MANAPGSSAPSDTDEGQRYAALCERAVSFINERGGTVHEDVLVRHVFGNAGSPAVAPHANATPNAAAQSLFSIAFPPEP